MVELAPGMRVRFARHPRNAFGDLVSHNEYDPGKLKDAFFLGSRDPTVSGQKDFVAYNVAGSNIGGRYWSWVRSDDVERVYE